MTRQTRAGRIAPISAVAPLPPRDRQGQWSKQAAATRSGNVRGGSSDPNRGTWCTPAPIARAVGRFDLDPFSNPRSHIHSLYSCMLERGDDGFGDGKPGNYFIKSIGHCGTSADTRVWLQPPYTKGFVEKAFRHYEHTRWVALLRFDPRTDWMKRVYARSEYVAVPWECEFEPPPGVADPGSTFPHALYFRFAADVTDEVRRMSICWRKTRHG